MSESVYMIAGIGTIALVTWLLRGAPFLLFRGRTLSETIVYLGRVLPPAIMAVLVIYCLQNVNLFAPGHGLEQLVPVALVILVHLWKKNTILSILTGTIAHMALLRL